MLVQTDTQLKCGIFGASLLCRRPCQVSNRRTWGLACFPTPKGRFDLTRNRLRCVKMSSQVMEKKKSSIDAQDCSENLPHSLSYESAMEALSSLISRKKRGGNQSPRTSIDKKMESMRTYLKILGLEENLGQLKIIHVAGTKGKGSTCVFCEAILRECGFQTGLFTSPHLIDVRERFRINGLDISEDKFLQYFWICWNLLKDEVTEQLPMPPLFQFLTLLAFKIFISERVDVAIIEVGLGGTNDSTNVVKEPVVCGITSLGMDHTETLGNSIGQIASHKAGIFKPQVPAFTVPQLPDAMEVIQEKAHKLMIPLEIAEPLDPKKLERLKLSLSGDHQLINSGLAISLCKCWLQRTGNWEKLFQKETQETDLPDAFYRGLSTAHISGRAQIVYDSPSASYNSSNLAANPYGDLIFYLDGAHSPESMEVCARWFSSAVKENHKSASLSPKTLLDNGYPSRHEKENSKILLFNCMDVRDPQILFPRLVNTCASSGTNFSKALFVPSMSTYSKVTSGASTVPLDTSEKDLSWQFYLQRLWEKIIHGRDIDTVFDKGGKIDSAPILPPRRFLYEDSPHSNPPDKNFCCSAVMPSLPLTIKWLRDCVKENPSIRVHILVTGSLHLVGDMLKLLRR